MRHPDDHFVRAVVGGAVDQFVEDRDGGLGAFERETLLAHEARVQEMLELFGLEQMVENLDPGRLLERLVIRLRLHAVLQPALLLRVLDVHVLDPDLAAVGAAQGFEESRAAWPPAAARLRRSLRRATR